MPNSSPQSYRRWLYPPHSHGTNSCRISSTYLCCKYLEGILTHIELSKIKLLSEQSVVQFLFKIFEKKNIPLSVVLYSSPSDLDYTNLLTYGINRTNYNQFNEGINLVQICSKRSEFQIIDQEHTFLVYVDNENCRIISYWYNSDDTTKYYTKGSFERQITKEILEETLTGYIDTFQRHDTNETIDVSDLFGTLTKTTTDVSGKETETEHEVSTTISKAGKETLRIFVFNEAYLQQQVDALSKSTHHISSGGSRKTIKQKIKRKKYNSNKRKYLKKRKSKKRKKYSKRRLSKRLKLN